MTGRKLSVIALILFFTLFGLACFASYILLLPPTLQARGENNFAEIHNVQEEAANLEDTAAIWFTGDVMLSRQVGQFGLSRGSDFSWRELKQIFNPLTEQVVINFEGCSAPGSIFLLSQPFRFPVSDFMVKGTSEAGVTHASLANNHSSDCGKEGARATTEILSANQIQSFGEPNSVSTSSVTYLYLDTTAISMLGINIIFKDYSIDELLTVVDHMNETSDFQIAYLHWGDEYSPLSNLQQRTLARQLVDLGVDLIIGHHPHVIQEVERIGNALVFYSLGNLIFDQYFSSSVQEGVLLKMVKENSKLVVELHPVTSEHERMQPRLMTVDERNLFMESWIKRSDPSLKGEMETKRLDLRFNLASSSKKAIIAP